MNWGLINQYSLRCIRSFVFSKNPISQVMDTSVLNMQQALDTNSNTENLSATNLDESLMCFLCKKSFTRKDALIRHMQIHLGKKHFNCSVCKKAFFRQSHLSRHMSSHLKASAHHKCDQCNEAFSRKVDLISHEKKHKPVVQYNCKQCSEVFLKKMELKTHEKKHKVTAKYKCNQCSETFTNKSAIIPHIRKSHPYSPPKPIDPEVKDTLFEKVKHFERQNALGVFSKIKIPAREDNSQDLQFFFNSIRLDITNELTYQLAEKKAFKWYTVVKVRLSRTSSDGEIEYATPHFHSGTILQLSELNLSSNIDDGFAKMLNSFEEFTERGSNWILEKVLYLEVSSAKYSPF